MVKKILVRVLPVLLALAIIPGCTTAIITTTSLESPIPTYYTNYTAENGLFSISYPAAGWGPEPEMLAEDEAAIKTFIADRTQRKPLEQPVILFVGGLPEAFVPTIIVLAEPLTENVAEHEALVAAKIESFKSAGTNFKEVQRMDTTMGGKQATIIEYSATLGSTARHDVVAFFADSGVVWSVTVAALQSNYKQYLKDQYLIVRSLRVDVTTG
jgi:hypothetical protein